MTTDHELLSRAAQRAVATHPRMLLATVLAEYPDEYLAAALCCPVAAIPRLRLCRPPRPERWADDVQRIAAHVGADRAALGALLASLAR